MSMTHQKKKKKKKDFNSSRLSRLRKPSVACLFHNPQSKCQKKLQQVLNRPEEPGVSRLRLLLQKHQLTWLTAGYTQEPD